MKRGRKGVGGTAYHNGGGTLIATRREFAGADVVELNPDRDLNA